LRDPKREMGPALRLTPLSPACGPHRSGKLDAWRFNAVSVPAPKSVPKSAYHRPALAPAPVPSELGPIRRSFPAAWRSRDRSLNPGLEQPRFARGLHQTSAPGRKVRPTDFAPSRPQRSSIRIAPGEPGALLVSFLRRAASRRRVEAVPKSLLRRRPFGLCLGRANPRLDVWKMRKRSDSGKRGIVQLSTFGPKASGQGWITQRLGADCADYPRSRC
jgi:hypothetical protein